MSLDMFICNVSPNFHSEDIKSNRIVHAIYFDTNFRYSICFSGPLLALALAREDAVTGWREKLGPKEVDKAKEEAPDSFRAQYAIDDVHINQFHGSDSMEAAQRELEYFFPMQQTVAAIKPDAFQTKGTAMHIQLKGSREKSI